MISRLSSSLTNTLRYSFGYKPRPYTSRPYEEIRNERSKYIVPFTSHYYKDPLMIVEGYRDVVYDHTGKEYIDLQSGFAVTNVGHNHPRLNKIYHDQVDKLLHISPIYMQEYQGEYSKRIC